MGNKLRWGILSAANIAYEQFLPAIQETTNQEIVAIASKSVNKVGRFGIEKVYDTYEGLLADDTIDAVYIPLPNKLHKEWALKAINAKKHVLLEKPATLNVADMKEIKQAVAENGVTFMEGFMYQFHPQHAYVQALLSDPVVGKVNYVKAHFSFQLKNQDDIRLNRHLGGGAIWDIGCYGIHALTQVIGIKPVTVTTISEMDEEKDVDVTSQCIFKDQENRIGEVSCSFKGAFENRYEIFTETGIIKVTDAFRPDASETGEGTVALYNNDGHLIQTESFTANQYTLQAEHFYEAIKNQVIPQYSADHSIEMINYIEKAYESMMTGKTVYV